jgi:hypothetical protein
VKDSRQHNQQQTCVVGNTLCYSHQISAYGLVHELYCLTFNATRRKDDKNFLQEKKISLRDGALTLSYVSSFLSFYFLFFIFHSFFHFFFFFVTRLNLSKIINMLGLRLDRQASSFTFWLPISAYSIPTPILTMTLLS